MKNYTIDGSSLLNKKTILMNSHYVIYYVLVIHFSLLTQPASLFKTGKENQILFVCPDSLSSLIFQKKLTPSPSSRAICWLDKQSVHAFPCRLLLAQGWEWESCGGLVNLKGRRHEKGEVPLYSMARHKQRSIDSDCPRQPLLDYKKSQP